MFVYFSTVVRSAPQHLGGEIIKLDWKKKQLLARSPIIPMNPTVDDPNPRGSTRGGRGILLNSKEVLVAAYHSLFVFDLDLNFMRQISNPLFANLHELSWEGNDLWATSTDIDAAIKIDYLGNGIESWWPREDPLIASRYNLLPLNIDKGKDNRVSFAGMGNTARSHVHLNAIAVYNNRPLILLNKFGVVVRLHPTEVIIENPQLRGCHNILVTAEGFILINDTVGRSLYIYDTTGRLRKRIVLTKFAPVRKILYRHCSAVIGDWLAEHGRPTRLFRHLFHRMTVARPIFVRGLCQVSEQSVLVGISPAAILEINWMTEKLLDMYVYSADRHICVHGLAYTGGR
jgi:hypothetical protein